MSVFSVFCILSLDSSLFSLSFIPTFCGSSGGRVIRVTGQNLDVVQYPRIRVTLRPLEPAFRGKKRKKRRSKGYFGRGNKLNRQRRIVPEAGCSEDSICDVKQVKFLGVCM